MITLGAIDVGSNAMRLAVGRFTERGQLKVLATQREPVRLGQDVFRNGQMSSAVLEQGVAAFLRFEAVLKAHKVDRVRAVGTSALRDATNGTLFIDRVQRASGIKLATISGEEEARLIHLAVAYEVELGRGNHLLIDIGGGSVEISLVDNGNITFSDSVRMGTVRLLEMMRGRRRSADLIERLVRDYAGGIKRQLQRGLRNRGIKQAIGTGGNIEALGDLRRTLLGKPNPKLLERGELGRLSEVLRRLSYRERISKLGLRPDRADVIMPAAALLGAILQEAEVSHLVIPRVGLREGLLIDMYQSYDDESEAEPLQRRVKQLVAYAVEFGHRFSFDERHAKHVAKLSLQLFDATKSIHKLNGEARVLLEIAAILHDIGHFIDGADHHKHSFYIINQSSFIGLSARQKELVALVARYHRGVFPSVEQSEWRDLNTHERKIVLLLSGIIRLVEEFDKEHLARISRVSARRRQAVLHIALTGRGLLLVERWGAERRKDLLERALGVSIVLS